MILILRFFVGRAPGLRAANWESSSRVDEYQQWREIIIDV